MSVYNTAVTASEKNVVSVNVLISSAEKGCK